MLFDLLKKKLRYFKENNWIVILNYNLNVTVLSWNNVIFTVFYLIHPIYLLVIGWKLIKNTIVIF